LITNGRSFLNNQKRHLKKLIRDGEYTDAIVFGKNLEPEYSDDSDFMFIMGSIYFIVDDATKALPYFEKIFSTKCRRC
jgi:hypothetical protein